MRPFIYSYLNNSHSARALRDALGTRLIRHNNSRYTHNPDNHLVVNWGSTECNNYENMLNRPDAVTKAASKLFSLAAFWQEGVPAPSYTNDKSTAARKMESGDYETVYCRTLTRANSGRGIVVASSPEELVDAPLYVQGITGPRREYRVHVFNGEVIRLQQKKRRTETAGEEYEANDDIRNYDGGWVFTTEGITPMNQAAIDDAIRAVSVLGLDFGAVDVVTQRDNHWVLEVNTACGLEGGTLDAYVEAIENYMEPEVDMVEFEHEWESMLNEEAVADAVQEVLERSTPDMGEVMGAPAPIAPEAVDLEPTPPPAPILARSYLRNNPQVGDRFIVNNSPYFGDGNVVEFSGSSNLFILVGEGYCRYNNGPGRQPGAFINETSLLTPLTEGYRPPTPQPTRTYSARELF